MKIAIVGAGVSGLVAAYLLRRRHDVAVFEAGGYAGGHTNTIEVERRGGTVAVDTGFIVFNYEYYPNFTRLLEALDVASQPTTMSLSVRDDAAGLEYCGRSLDGIFAQRRNVVNWRFLRMLVDVLRFQREGVKALETLGDEVSVDEFVTGGGYSEAFYRHFLLPLGSALWSAPVGTFRTFPMRFALEFFRNHGMMQILGRPAWRVVRGGSYRYVQKLTSGWRDRIHLNCPVRRVERERGQVLVKLDAGQARFDEVILACHSDQALGLLAEPQPEEREILEMFPYQANGTVLHTDTTLLPRSQRAWGCWNYCLSETSERAASVTYNMNLLQGLNEPEIYCVSLNQKGIDPDRVIGRFDYHHPLYRPGRQQVQARHRELIRRDGVSFCGAYWGFGFHEDGVRSALAVCQAFGEHL